MQAVILAAGRGTRMGDLTEDTPKPMLQVSGMTLLEHKLESLPSEIDEVIIVVGYLGDKIKNHLGSEFKGRKINYIFQEKLLGTGDSLWMAKNHLGDRFMVMMGDDIYCREDLAECLKHDRSVLIKKMEFLGSGGRVIFDESGRLKEIIEGTHNLPNAHLNLGLYVLGKEIFNYALEKIPGREEYGLPQTLVKAINDITVNVVDSNGYWIQVTSPEDLIEAEKRLS